MSPPAPGAFLRELCKGRITQERLAKAMKVSRYSVSQIINGHRTVTADMAMRLARATSTTPEFWLKLQLAADLDKARRRLGKRLDAIQVLRKEVPESEMFYDLAEG